MEERTLEQIAADIRISLFKAFAELEGGHYGACFSITEIMTQLYFREMRVDPANPQWPERDRFVLSKGHAGFGLYATLAERGFFPREFLTSRRDGIILPKHADKHRVPGVDVSTGSLGQGLSIAVGMAIAARRQDKGIRVFALMGDGELNEGQIWEAAMAAAKYGLDNLVGIVDNNRLQVDGPPEAVMPIEPLADKWRSFGWAVEKAAGHDFAQLGAAFERARKVRGQPAVVIAQTIKGKGVSFMENARDWHGGTCTPAQLEIGLGELQAAR